MEQCHSSSSMDSSSSSLVTCLVSSSSSYLTLFRSFTFVDPIVPFRVFSVWPHNVQSFQNVLSFTEWIPANWLPWDFAVFWTGWVVSTEYGCWIPLGNKRVSRSFSHPPPMTLTTRHWNVGSGGCVCTPARCSRSDDQIGETRTQNKY